MHALSVFSEQDWYRGSLCSSQAFEVEYSPDQLESLLYDMKLHEVSTLIAYRVQAHHVCVFIHI